MLQQGNVDVESQNLTANNVRSLMLQPANAIVAVITKKTVEKGRSGIQKFALVSIIVLE